MHATSLKCFSKTVYLSCWCRETPVYRGKFNIKLILIYTSGLNINKHEFQMYEIKNIIYSQKNNVKQKQNNCNKVQKIGNIVN